jgi:hypothetical protein
MFQSQSRTGTPVLPVLGDDAKLDGNEVVDHSQLSDAIEMDVAMEQSQSLGTSQPEASSSYKYSPSRLRKAGEAIDGATIDEWIARRAHVSAREKSEDPDSAQQSSAVRKFAQKLKARYGYSSEELERQAEEARHSIRVQLYQHAGGAQEAFRAMDLSGSGQLSLTEFTNGLRRLGVDWKEITGLSRERDVFKMFDKEAPVGVISLIELFPHLRAPESEAVRASTPEFWERYCEGTEGTGVARTPQWSKASSEEEEMQKLFEGVRIRQEISDRRQWIASTMTRLRGQGKSSARCREVCIRHLPRGTGPKDCDDVRAFSEKK